MSKAINKRVKELVKHYGSVLENPKMLEDSINALIKDAVNLNKKYKPILEIRVPKWVNGAGEIQHFLEEVKLVTGEKFIVIAMVADPEVMNLRIPRISEEQKEKFKKAWLENFEKGKVMLPSDSDLEIKNVVDLGAVRFVSVFTHDVEEYEHELQQIEEMLKQYNEKQR